MKKEPKMRYVRVLSKIYVIDSEDRDAYWFRDGNKRSLVMKYCCKASVSITGLCEAFAIREDYNIVPVCLYQSDKDAVNHVREKRFYRCSAYGGVWTEQGFDYLAKLNKKGDWELL